MPRGFDITLRSRSRTVLIRRWASGRRKGDGRSTGEASLSPRRWRGGRGRREHAGPRSARRTFPVNGERRPRASVQSGRETTLGPRVVHYSLCCSPLTSLSSTRRRDLFSVRSTARSRSSFLFLSVPFLTFIYFYFVIVIIVIIM